MKLAKCMTKYDKIMSVKGSSTEHLTILNPCGWWSLLSWPSWSWPRTKPATRSWGQLHHAHDTCILLDTINESNPIVIICHNVNKWILVLDVVINCDTCYASIAGHWWCMASAARTLFLAHGLWASTASRYTIKYVHHKCPSVQFPLTYYILYIMYYIS